MLGLQIMHAAFKLKPDLPMKDPRCRVDIQVHSLMVHLHKNKRATIVCCWFIPHF
jgi:hypothetical protein